MMQTYFGKSVFKGISIGKLWIFSSGNQEIVCTNIQDTDNEIVRYDKACKIMKAQLKELYDKACNETEEKNAAIFKAYQMILDDEEYIESVKNIIISHRVNVEYAVNVTARNFINMFDGIEDEYIRARAVDIRDVSDKLIKILKNEKDNIWQPDEPVIVLADDLSPSETIQMDKDKILSFVTVNGSVNSHTAILARTMSIPTLVNTKLVISEELNGKEAIVDGIEGVMYVNPDEETILKMKEKKAFMDKEKRIFLDLMGKDDITLDGHKIMLHANIGNIRDLEMVINNDANGIGLFRSEFIYLESQDYPTEDAQFEIYKTAAEAMSGKRVIIRTLDLGADKQADYFSLDKEENPALGYRGIRICLTQTELFKTQLRAILRASVYGNIAVMYPMITSVDEVRAVKCIMEEIRQEFSKKQIEYREIKQGIMIETPAAVMISEELAKEVDFFSIGTNDLTQYTLAIDRQNPRLDKFYNAYHPAVFKMIKMTVENAHKAGIWAGICGELGADTMLTQYFLEMGIDELSVSPTSILPIRNIIRQTNFSHNCK